MLADKLEANLGYIYENLVAQMLAAAGNKLFYYTFKKDEKRSYEVDFLLSRGNKICPIELKSSGYMMHASLDAFRTKYSARIKNSYLLYTKDLKIGDNELMCLPFYMTGMIVRFDSEIRWKTAFLAKIFGGKRQKRHCKFGGKRHFKAKIFGGK